MKRMCYIMTLGLLLLACVCGCAAPAAQTGNAQIPNPIREMTAEELSEKAGFSFGTPEGAEDAAFAWIDGAEVAQAVFTWGGDAYSFRAKQGDPQNPEEDIAGMHYEWTWTNAASGKSPKLYLTDEGQGYAAWNADGILYSVSMGAGATKQKLGDMAGLLREAFCPEIKYDKIPMVMVDGKLYYDTGRKSAAVHKCGTMDGRITSTVDGNQTPAENDQSNFGAGYRYRFCMQEQDAIEVLLDEKWIVFEHRPSDGSTQISAIAFSAQYVRTDGSPDGMTYPVAEVICSREELTAYYEAHRGGTQRTGLCRSERGLFGCLRRL